MDARLAKYPRRIRCRRCRAGGASGGAYVLRPTWPKSLAGINVRRLDVFVWGARTSRSELDQLHARDNFHTTAAQRAPPTPPPFTDQEMDVPPTAAAKPVAQRRRRDIDGLRCIAVLAVLVFHLRESSLPGGFTGVDCFFCISGYVVTTSMLHTLPASGASCKQYATYLARFYARRVKRLAPALVFTVLLVSVLCTVQLPTETQLRRLREYLLSGQTALFGFANIRFAISALSGWGGYWADSADSPKYDPFTHAWSLGVEEQYYLVFPLLMLGAYGHAPRACCQATQQMETVAVDAPIPAHPPRSVRPAVLLGGSLLASLALSGWLSASSYPLAFYLMPSRWWQLVSGALLAHCEHQHAELWDTLVGTRPRAMAALDTIGVACLIAGLVWTPPGDDIAFPLPWALLTTSGTLCLLLSGSAARPPRTAPCSSGSTLTPSPPLLQAILGHPLPVYIGQSLSYSLYLSHWPVIVLLRHSTPYDHCAAPAAATLLAVTALLLALAIALVSHHVVEGFFHTWGPARLRKPHCATIVLLPAIIAAAGLLQSLKTVDVASRGYAAIERGTLPADEVTSPDGFAFAVRSTRATLACDRRPVARRPRRYTQLRLQRHLRTCGRLPLRRVGGARSARGCGRGARRSVHSVARSAVLLARVHGALSRHHSARRQPRGPARCCAASAVEHTPTREVGPTAVGGGRRGGGERTGARADAVRLGRL